MKPLASLKNLLRTLSTPEIKLVRRLLQLREDSSPDNDHIKSLQLLDLLLKHPQVTAGQLLPLVYPQNPSENTLRMLASRLYRKITETLLLDMNLSRKSSYSDYWAAFFTVKKDLLTSYILRVKGLYAEVLELYDSILATAGQYEFYEEITEVLREKKNVLTLLHDKKVDTLDLPIEYYEQCRLAKQQARNLYYQLDNEELKAKAGYTVYLKNAIDRLEEKAEITGSANTGYYLQLIKVQYYQQIKDYGQAKKAALELMEIVKNPSVYVKRRAAHALSLLSEAELLQGQFAEAAEHASEASRDFPMNANYGLIKENEFYASFYNGEFGRAEKIVRELLDKPLLTVSPYQQSKRNYLLACVLLLRKDYRASHHALQETHEITKAEEEWKAGARLLTIMQLLERKELDIAHTHISNFREHSYKQKKKNKPLRKRQQMILELLVKLSQYGFDYKKVWNKHRKDFELLASGKPDYCWEVKSPEMIAFHDWFASKVLCTPYTLSLQKRQPQALPLAAL